MRTFTLADYIVLVAVLIILTAIGLYYRYSGGRQSSTEEYVLGDRSQSVLPVALSLAASHMSGIAILGTPAEVYFRGAIFFIANLSLIIVIPVTVHLILPVFFKVGSSSTYEYLFLRFGGRVRCLASITYPVQSVMFMTVVLYAPSLALETLSGLPTLWSIIIVGSVCTFYSTIGGIKAVIMTDVFQFTLTILAVLAIIVIEYLDKGGFTNIFKIAYNGGRLNFSKAGSIASQDQLVPYYVVDVLDKWPGMGGLIMAGVFSASLSSISATLNSLANICVHDFIMPFYHSNEGPRVSLTDSQQLVLSKLVACLCGGLLIVIAYLGHYLSGILQAGLTLTGLVGGPMASTFLLGMFVPRANEAGALASLASGLTLSLWLNFGGARPPVVNLPSSTTGCSNTTVFDPHYVTTVLKSEQYPYIRRLSYWWYVVLSSLLAFLSGLIVSWITKKPEDKLLEKDTDLFSPPVADYIKKFQHENNKTVEFKK